MVAGVSLTGGGGGGGDGKSVEIRGAGVVKKRESPDFRSPEPEISATATLETEETGRCGEVGGKYDNFFKLCTTC